jgi:signal transduction histidine kinase
VNDGGANSYLDPYFSNLCQGKISFTSGNRIFTFNPDSFKFNQHFPKPYLADMNIFGDDYLFEALHGIVKLSARQRFVNFTASALQFTSPASVRFQYRLEGLEDNWNNSDNGEIKYTNLPWGYNYKLLVRVSNPSGQFGPEKMLAKFTIATPFYASWWFILSGIIAVAGLVFAAYQYRVNQLIALQKVRNKIARDLHDDIGSALGGISFLSEAATQQLQQSDTAGAERMLAKIGYNSRETVENISDIVWSVNPKNDPAKFLIDRMRVFATDLVVASGIKIQFYNDADVEQVKLSMEQRKNIFLIFKEAIYNSVKYSGCRSITVNIYKTVKGLQLIIKDDGAGFDTGNYTSKNGNGIQNMRLRADEVKCDFSIESSPAGTVIRLKI